MPIGLFSKVEFKAHSSQFKDYDYGLIEIYLRALTIQMTGLGMVEKIQPKSILGLPVDGSLKLHYPETSSGVFSFIFKNVNKDGGGGRVDSVLR